MKTFILISKAIAQLASGKATGEPLRLAWGVHDGIRGARWTVVQSDGRVLERSYTPGTGLAGSLPEKTLGWVPEESVRDLARVLLNARFDALNPPELDEAMDPASAQVELAVEAGQERFLLRIFSAQLEQAPEMATIAHAFTRLRSLASSSDEIRCLECGARYSIPAVFERCGSSFPEMYWLFFPCATCERMWVLEVSPGLVAFGEFEEFPPHPDSFIPIREMPLPGFSAEVHRDGIRLRLGEQVWSIPG